MKKILTILLIMCLLILSSCKKTTTSIKNSVTSDTLYAKKLNLSDDFIFGMDASSVISLENSGVKYYSFDGTEQDVFKTFSENGINYIRVRIWNDPYNSDGNGYGGGNNDVDTAIEIGKRATKYGMKLLVDFHYSDFWADPSKQMVPKAWEGMKIDAKAEALYNFTKDTLNKMKEAGVDVGMVQVGNETNGSMCGETIWRNIIYSLMGAGSRAIREVYPEALVAVHFANPEKTDNYYSYASKLAYYELDYDVFGTSYYPYWHGTLENLSTVLSTISEQYNKKVMVMETSYAYTTEDTDFWTNTIGTSGYDSKNYPFTIAGQANCISDIVETVSNIKNGIGVCYWEGAWISVGTKSLEENQELWEKYGSGWASSYAVEYDKDDAGKWYGGSAVDNQAFFDSTGHPLESLKIFALLRTGNNVEKYVDGVEEVSAIFYTYDKEFKLPDKVNVIYSDNSKAEVDVEWEKFDIEEARKKGNAKYQISGTASGYTTYLNLSVLEYNFMKNYSFEEEMDSWNKIINSGTLSDTHKVQITNENPETGTYAFHFWTSDSDGVNFDLTQDITGLTDGKYKFQASILGGSSGTSSITEEKENCYIYVKVNDIVVKTTKAVITCYSDGYQDYVIEDIDVLSTDKVTVGIHIEISEANCWGDIDDTLFNIVE